MDNYSNLLFLKFVLHATMMQNVILLVTDLVNHVKYTWLLTLNNVHFVYS